MGRDNVLSQTQKMARNHPRGARKEKEEEGRYRKNRKQNVGKRKKRNSTWRERPSTRRPKLKKKRKTEKGAAHLSETGTNGEGPERKKTDLGKGPPKIILNLFRTEKGKRRHHQPTWGGKKGGGISN